MAEKQGKPYMKLNDDEAATAFSAWSGNVHVSVPGKKGDRTWYKWNDHIWKVTQTTQNDVLAWVRAQDLYWDGVAKEEAKKRVDSGATADGKEQQRVPAADQLAFFRKRLSNTSGLNSLISMLGAHTTVAGEMFDKNPDVVAVSNGYLMLDPSTGDHRLMPPNKYMYITKSMGVAYNPKAKCPNFDNYMKGAIVKEDGLTHDPDTAAWLDLALGYTLSGRIDETVIAILHGLTGDNGKSVLVDLMHDLFGDYTAHCSPKAFGVMTSRFDDGTLDVSKPQDDIAGLQGARWAYANELTKGARFDTASIKNLTDQYIRARKIWQAPVGFKATHFAWLSGNHLPSSDDDSHSFWRRICVVPFYANFSERDDAIDRKTMDESLRAEMPGILNRMLRGYKRLISEKLSLRDSVSELMVAARDKYRSDNDAGTPREFFQDYATKGNGAEVEFRCSSKDFMRGYKAWCVSRCIPRHWGLQSVSAALAELGYPSARGRCLGLDGEAQNTSYYVGFHLRDRVLTSPDGSVVLADDIRRGGPGTAAFHTLPE